MSLLLLKKMMMMLQLLVDRRRINWTEHFHSPPQWAFRVSIIRCHIADRLAPSFLYWKQINFWLSNVLRVAFGIAVGAQHCFVLQQPCPHVVNTECAGVCANKKSTTVIGKLPNNNGRTNGKMMDIRHGNSPKEDTAKTKSRPGWKRVQEAIMKNARMEPSWVLHTVSIRMVIPQSRRAQTSSSSSNATKSNRQMALVNYSSD